MPINDIYQVKAVAFDTDQLGLNVRHYVVVAATAPEPTRVQIAQQFYTAMNAIYGPMLNNNATFRGFAVRFIWPGPVSVEDHSTGAAIAGTAGAISAPRQTAGLIKLSTGLAGRTGRGRIYVPFPATASVQLDGSLGPAYTTNLATLAGAWSAQVVVPNGAGSITLQPIIWHRSTHTFSLVTGAIPRTVWATQRRRGGFGRTNLMPF